MTDMNLGGSPETTNSSSVTPTNTPQTSAPTQGTPETQTASASQTDTSQSSNNQQPQGERVHQAVLDAYMKQQEQVANRQQSQLAGFQPAFDPYQGLTNLQASQAQAFGQNIGGFQPQTPEQAQGFDPNLAAQFAPPRPGDADYNNYVEWMVNNPQEYDQYLAARQEQLVEQKFQQIQQQQQMQQFVETKFKEYEDQVANHIKTNYHPALYENETCYKAVDWMMQIAAEELPRDPNGRAFDPETGMYITSQQLTDKAIGLLKQYGKELMPILQAMEAGNQPTIPSNNFVASGNLAAPSYGSGGDIAQQIQQARAAGNHALADRLQIQAMMQNY